VQVDASADKAHLVDSNNRVARKTWRHAMTKITNTLLVALALAGASLTTQGPSQAEQNWLDRASQPDNERNAFGY
jgi:homoserine acetyltransferase